MNYIINVDKTKKESIDELLTKSSSNKHGLTTQEVQVTALMIIY